MKENIIKERTIKEKTRKYLEKWKGKKKQKQTTAPFNEFHIDIKKSIREFKRITIKIDMSNLFIQIHLNEDMVCVCIEPHYKFLTCVLYSTTVIAT